MYIEGIVTAQDYILGTFTLNKLKVHCIYKFINNDKSFVIPPLGEKVCLDGVTKINKRNAVLTKFTNVEFFGLVPSNSAFQHNIKFCAVFGDLVMKYTLKPCDIVYIDSVKYPFLYSEEFFNEIACQSVFPGTLEKYLTVRTVEYLLNYLCADPKQLENSSGHSVFKNKLKDYKIYGPERFKICKKFLKMPSIYWHYGTEMCKEFEYLAGFLRVEPKLGLLILRDQVYKIACVVINEDGKMKISSKKNLKILNKFVLINKYKIFTEYYNDFGPVQYLVVNLRDIFVLETGDFIAYSPETHRSFWYRNKNQKDFNITIHILHKSTVTETDIKLKFTLHCIILSQNNLECVLQFESLLVGIHPQFNVNDIYELKTKMLSFQEEIEYRKSSLSTIINNKSVPSFNVPLDTEFIFQTNSEYTGPEKIPVRSVKAAIDILKNTLSCYQDIHLISFEGILVKRQFLEPLPSQNKWGGSKSKVFGTPGTQVHQLILKDVASDHQNEPNILETFVAFEETEEMAKLYEKAVMAPAKLEKPPYVSVYLHNWGNLQCPLGLIPGMTLRIKYVVTQKGKYFKPMHLTSIEVVKYDDSLNFETCYSFPGLENWGPSYPLGLGQNVPTNCLCQSRTEIITIKYLNLVTKCNQCEEKVNKEQDLCCEKTDYQLNMLLVLNVVDEGGRSDVITKDDNLLRKLLGKREEEWNLMKLAFLNLRSYKFSATNTEDRPNEIYENALTYFFRGWNNIGMQLFRLKCRKLEKNANDNNDNPKWFLIEAEEI